MRKIEESRFYLDQLFRKYNIKSQGIDGIREGARKHGNTFIWLAADVLASRKNKLSNYTWAEPDDVMGPKPYDYTIGADTTTKEKKDIFEWLSMAIGVSNAAADSFAKWKNPTSPDLTYEAVTEASPVNQNFILIGAGIAVLIVIILIFKK